MPDRFPPGTVAALAAVLVVIWWATRRSIGLSDAANVDVDRRARASASGSRWVVAAVAAVTLSSAAALTPEAWLHGWTLSQAHLLFGFLPWSAVAPAALPPRNPLLGDAAFQGYPWLSVTCESFARGELPLWNPFNFAGHPFLASFLPGVFSPFTALACLAPLPWSVVVAAAARLVASGTGMYLWTRALGVSVPAALFATVAGCLNPFMLVWLEDASGSVAAAAPWLLWAVTRAAEAPNRHSIALVALTSAFVLVAGQPETAFKVAVFAAPFALLRAWTGSSPRHALAALATGCVLGLLLAAVQLVPFVEYAGESRVLAERVGRDVNTSFTARSAFVTGLVPDFFGHPASHTVTISNRYGEPTNYVEQTFFAGTSTWILAVIGVASGWRRTRALIVPGVLGLLLKFGAPGLLLLASALPLFRVTPLGRFGLLVILAAIPLAALGIDTVLGAHAGPTMSGSADGRAGRQRRLVTVAATVALVAVSSAIAVSLVAERAVLMSSGLWPGTLLKSTMTVVIAAATTALVVACSRGWLRAALTLTLLVALAGAELVAFGRAFRPLVPPDLVFPAIPALTRMTDDGDVFRVAGWGSVLPANTNAVHHLAQYRGYDSVNPLRYGRLLDRALGSERQLFVDRAFDDRPIFDLLNVKYLLTRADVAVPPTHFERVGDVDVPLYRNRRAFARAFLADGYVVAPEAQALELVGGGTLDLSRHVVLETPPDPGTRPEPRASTTDTATIRHYRPRFIEIETEASGRRLLVLTDIHYPGWRARVDGHPVPILVADYAFRAIPVPAGQHIVTFEYVPNSFRVGGAITIAAAFIVASLLAWPVLRKRTS